MRTPTSTPGEKIIATLRQQLKAGGHHYRDVASRLGVSQGTVKRYLNGKGVTIDVLQRLAEIVELDLLSLAALAQQESTAMPEPSKAQKEALRKNELLRLTYFMVVGGWTPLRIAQEFELSPQKMETALDRLQTLGLIRRLSAQGIQILVRSKFEKRREGEFAELTIDGGMQFLREVNLRDPNCEWASNGGRLSPASVTRLRKMIKSFVTECLQLSSDDIDLPPQQVQWYRLFVGAQPAGRKRLFRSG